ncbi:hypothetical protein ACLOJK_020986 [Asimina triloba]
MEAWVPLFDIFLNSSSPEGEASLWMQQQQQSSRSPPLSTSAFLSLLLKPQHTQGIIWLQTLPNLLQSRILSFLTIESHRFSAHSLHSLAAHILTSHSNHHDSLDFWVKKAARNLLDKTSSRNSTPFRGSNSSAVKGDDTEEEFSALPDWLRSHTSVSPVLPWLPFSPEAWEVKMEENRFVNDNVNKASVVEMGNDSVEDTEVGSNQAAAVVIEPECTRTLDPEIHAQAAVLKYQLLNSKSAMEIISVANGVTELCSDYRVGDPFAILGLVEPWEANEEVTSILISNLLDGKEDQPMWSVQVLSSVILPQLLILQNTVSRSLAMTTIECCKLHQKAAVDAILIPLVLRKEGINIPLCDLITRIVKECLHTTHTSAFCQKLLCGDKAARRRSLACLPYHRCLISDKLIWTEPLFALFQNILNMNVYLTPDSVDYILSCLGDMADQFPKSLKFGGFFLCFISKCAPLLKNHGVLLMKIAKKTDTFMTKSILSRLGSW